MANLMGILGGVGQGISAGVQDLDRMEEAKNRKEEAQFRKELQQRERERFAEEKRVAEQIKGIQSETPAEYDESMSTITKPATKLSRSQMLARQADIYSSSPDRATQQLGLQMSQASRGEKETEDLQGTKTKYEEARKLLNTDLEKFQQTYPALFNADKIGGPETKGMIMAPMSTAKGTVYNVMTPQGQSVMQIPVDKQSLGRALDSMYYSELAGINPKYAELVMKNEQINLEREGLGIKRMAGESDAQYKTRLAKVYEDRAALDKEEFGVKKNSGFFNKAEQPFTPIGVNDDGTKILGRQGSRIVESPIPPGYSKGLFSKVTGADSPKRDETLKEWAAVERDLMKSEVKPEAIRQQQIQFYARRGVAPQESEDAIASGTYKGKPLTEKDVDDYNRRYPNSKVNKAELDWLKK